MNVAFIPVRGGSKSIPLKNIKEIGGKPLVYWTVKAACDCSKIDKVYIATDSEKIKEVVEGFGFSKASVIGRSAESATDTASTEFVMLEFAEKYDFDNIVLIQATSPLLRGSDLDRGFEIFNEDNVDSVLSGVLQKRFNWEVSEDGFTKPINYDVYNRKRRQDFDGYYTENGAFYITSKELLLKSKNRISGNIKMVPMCEESFFEIDEPSDFAIIEKLMERVGVCDSSQVTVTDSNNQAGHNGSGEAQNASCNAEAGYRCSGEVQKNDCNREFGEFYMPGTLKEGTVIPEIKMFLTDCDGCLTDGGMFYSEEGDELKKFFAKDGLGIRLISEAGVLTGIVTGEMRELNFRRFSKLKMDIYEPGCKTKGDTLRMLSEKYNVPLENICYVGDDLNDMSAVIVAGFACCPADAVEAVKEKAHYIASKDGGRGAVREVIDLVLENNERLKK